MPETAEEAQAQTGSEKTTGSSDRVLGGFPLDTAVLSPPLAFQPKMLKVAEYRQHAADCRKMASTAKLSEQRQMLEKMAESWDALANEREQFLKLHPAEGR